MDGAIGDRALERAKAHFKTVLEARARNADPSVEVHFYKLPWSSESLGPSIVDTGFLRKIGENCISDGVRNQFTPQNQPIHWIERREQLISNYQAALRDADGKEWQAFEEALKASWELNRDNTWLQNTYGSPSVIEVLDTAQGRAWFAGNDWSADQTWFVGRKCAEAALEQTWHNAFRTGQILVFRQQGACYSFLPPHSFETAPPFPCVQVDELQHVWEREFKSEKRRNAEQRKAREQAGMHRISDGLFPSLDLDLADPAYEGVLGKSQSCADQPVGSQFAFLLSRDLPLNWHQDDVGVASKKQTKLKSGRSSFDLHDQPLVDEALQRLQKDKFSKMYAVVNDMYREDPLRFVGGGIDESKMSRVRKKVSRALGEMER